METKSIYESYLSSLTEIVEQIGNDAASKDKIAQEERNSISEIEKKFMHLSEELNGAKKTVRDQYRSVWESCTKGEGLKKPQDMRPVVTDLDWKEAVRQQEQAAARIRDYFARKSQQAMLERQRKMQEEAARRAAQAAAEAEAKKRQAEEEARREREKAEALVEEMKRKHRKGY